MRRLVGKAVDEFGRLDVLVSNAGISEIGPNGRPRSARPSRTSRRHRFPAATPNEIGAAVRRQLSTARSGSSPRPSR
ncbi:hypothetical protein ACFQ16_03050 [Saccharopolyspora rosea]|uniref:Uncharacterized protein n=1 Tax=Saccharopolyspora rosea TaxID=524884 RepID=A0ABW3FNX3_9PSEU